MVGVINLRRRKVTQVGSSVPTQVVPVSSAGPYQPVAGYVPGSVPNLSGGATGTGTGNVVVTDNLLNPRSSSNIPLGLGESSTYDLGTRNITLTSGVTTDQTINLPMLADTIELDFVLTTTITGGSGTFDFFQAIDHVQLATAQGTIKALIPGTFLKANYLRFSATRQGVSGNTSSTSGSTYTIVIPGLRLPRAYGPWQLTVFYSSIATAALPGWVGATAITVSNHLLGYYGSAGGKISRYIQQSLALVNGTNMIQTTSVPQNVPIAELFISGLAAVTDITQILLQTNGQIIEPNSSGSFISARDTQRLYASPPGGQLILMPPTQFTLNSSSEFQIVTSNTENGNMFLWYWLE